MLDVCSLVQTIRSWLRSAVDGEFIKAEVMLYQVLSPIWKMWTWKVACLTRAGGSYYIIYISYLN